MLRKFGVISFISSIGQLLERSFWTSSLSPLLRRYNTCRLCKVDLWSSTYPGSSFYMRREINSLGSSNICLIRFLTMRDFSDSPILVFNVDENGPEMRAALLSQFKKGFHFSYRNYTNISKRHIFITRPWFAYKGPSDTWLLIVLCHILTPGSRFHTGSKYRPTATADKRHFSKSMLEVPMKLKFFLISKTSYETEEKRRTKRSFRGT